jgi:Protein of unknown function (DUF3892)
MVSEPVQISCVIRGDGSEVGARITHIGGDRDPGRWRITQEEAIEHIENQEFRFWVSVEGKSVWVVVGASLSGTKYLKTEADGSAPRHLLSLPDCP